MPERRTQGLALVPTGNKRQWGGVVRAESQKHVHSQATVSRKRPERGSLKAPLPKLRGNIWNEFHVVLG